MGELSTARELVGALALGVQAACALGVGMRVGRTVGGDDRLLAALVGTLAALATAIGVVLALGVVGLLSLPAVVLVSLLAVLGLVRLGRPSGTNPSSGGGARLGLMAVVAIGAGAAYVTLGVDLSLGPASTDFDTREYHIANLATWLQQGDIWELPYQSPSGVSATHPGDAELLGVWLALPSHGDELAYVMPVAFGILALLAGAVLARELGGWPRSAGNERAAIGALAALAVIGAPLYLSSQVASLSTDLTVAACATAALALLVAAHHRGSPPPLVVAAGVALGMGLGSKYTALVPTFAIAALAPVLLTPRRRWWWLVPGVVGLAAPWFVRNLVATGNPLFPQELGPLGGGHSPFEVLDDPVLEHLLRGRGGIIGDWLELGARFVGPAALLAGAGVVVGAVVWRRSRAAAVVTLVAVAAFAGYLAVPFSGGGPLGFPHLIASSLRYGMTALLLGAVVLAGRGGLRGVGAAVAAVLAVDLWRLRTFVPDQRPDLGVGDAAIARAALVGLVVAACVWFAPRRQFVRARRGTTCAFRRVGGDARKDDDEGRAGPLARRRTPRASSSGRRNVEVVSRRTLTGPLVLGGASAAVAALGFVGLHRLDRGTTPSALEAALDARGGLDRPVVPLGVVDLRSMLGPRLDRPLIGVSRRGRAGEAPFATHDQARRLLLGDTDAPRAPASLADELDRELADAPADLLAVGPDGAGAYPEGWAPDGTWCGVDAAGRVTVYERCERAGTVPAP